MSEIEIMEADLTIADGVLDDLNWQMDNCLPAKGESSARCSERRLRTIVAETVASVRIQARNAALEEAARVADNPGFIEARDTEWDIGVNDAKRMIATAVRTLTTTTTKGDD